VVFYLLLIRVWPLSKDGWRIVDYVWLSAGAVGLIGATSQGRQLVAENVLRTYTQIEKSAYDPLFGYLENPNRDDYLCRKIQPATFRSAEEADRLQEESDRFCAWYREIERILAGIDRESVVPRNTFPPSPVVTDRLFQNELEDFERWLNQHNNLRVARLSLEAAAKRSDAEQMLTVFSPLLLALALALRITKVTGERRLDRLAAGRCPPCPCPR
jgi:hypothetical protein